MNGENENPPAGARDAVTDAAIAWWESHRPLGWTLDDHLKTPDVNCTVTTEQELAYAVASIVSKPDANLWRLPRELPRT